jgi:hypothetical protein
MSAFVRLMNRPVRTRIALPIAGFAVFVFYLVLAHVNYWPGQVWGKPKGFEWTSPTATGGDEPHYLMIANSLLDDHDLRLEDDFKRVKAGGYEAGIAYKGQEFGGHTYLVNARTKKFTLCVFGCTEKEESEVGGKSEPLYQVPSHPWAFPLFLAILTAPFRPSSAGVEARIGVMLALIAALGVLLTYWAARLSGQSTKAAIASAAIVGFASPWLVYSRSYFSDPTLGVLALGGLIALRKDRPVVAGLLIGVAMAMKSILLLFGFAWIFERVLAKQWRQAAALTVTIGICGVVLLAANIKTLPEPLASGAMRITAARDLRPLWLTLYEPEHGLFTFTPWAIPAVLWGPLSLWKSRRLPTLGEGSLETRARKQIVFGAFAVMLVFASVGFGPGWCYGPRFYVPLYPFLAMLAVDWVVVAKRRLERSFLVALATYGLVAAVPAAPQYHWLFSRKPFEALTGPGKTV